MATPVADQDGTAHRAMQSAPEEDTNIPHTHIAEDGVPGVDKEPVFANHSDFREDREDAASPSWAENQVEESSIPFASSDQEANDSPSSLMVEICSLRDKLQLLEKRMRQPASGWRDIRQHRRVRDEQQLRKRIRRAPFAKNLVQKAEALAINPGLNLVKWEQFKNCRTTDAKSSFVIDVLIGEPQIQAKSSQHCRNKTLKQRPTPHRSRTAESHQAQKGGGWGQGSVHMTISDRGAPLPERIRINSREIIKTLAIIQGSEFTSDDTFEGSIVMVRPYRMLTYYESEIRQWHSRLEKQYRRLVSKEGASPGDDEMTDELGIDLRLLDDEIEGTRSIQQELPLVPDPEGLSESRTTLEHLGYLLKFMDDYLRKRLDYLESTSCERIYFSDLWHLFIPGDQIISADGKQAYQVFNVTMPPHVGTERWSQFAKGEKDSDEDYEPANDGIVIQCVFVHFDGHQIGPVAKSVSIAQFDGEKAVTSLGVYPLRFHVRKKLDRQIMTKKPTDDDVDKALKVGVAELRETLIERGQLFIEVAAVKHMYYSGLTVGTRDEVQSQVMVDFAEAFLTSKHTDWLPDLKHLIGMIEADDTYTLSFDDSSCRKLCCSDENVHNSTYIDNKRHQDFMKEMLRGVNDGIDDLPPAAIYPRPLRTLGAGSSQLTRDDLLIMSYSVFGFVLRDRSWAELDLTYLTHISDSVDNSSTVNDDDGEDDKTAFGRLVLPPGLKKMVLSLVSQHFRNKASQQERDTDEQVDIVRGKGKGLTILLHGAPGVGKTTTAEAVAEKFKKPLFQITCGDLGSSPKEVEEALQTNFARANRWGCILLLDEADVFLAERRRDDFNRNGLVAVFLRVLEYYAGILFLTTNRIGDFDEAFVSRIHMSLHYPPLTLLSTFKIFALNLKMIKRRYQEADRKITIDMELIEAYAEKYWMNSEKARLNGRQIRNACQTALALAEFDAQPEDSKYDLAARSNVQVHLTAKHIQTVSEAYLEFIEYLKAVHGTDAETHANEAGLRALETAYLAMRSGAGHRGIGSTEGRQNSLHRFKLKTQSPQSPTQMRPDQGDFAQQHRRGSSSGQAPMGPYSTPARMGVPQPAMAPYGQTINMPIPNYQQNQNGSPTAEQSHSGGQQHFSPSQHGSYSPSPSGSALQYQHLTGDATNPNMTSMYGLSTVPFGQQDPSSRSIWSTNVDDQ